MKTAIERILISLYAITYFLTNKFKRHRQTRNVLIVFQQIFGDAVVISSSLKAYTDYYCKRGYKVTFLCRPAIAKFMKELIPVPEQMSVETVDYSKLLEDFRYYRDVVAKYRNSVDILVSPGSTISAELLSTSINAPLKVGVDRAFPRKWPPQMVLFLKMAYSDLIVPKVDEMMIQRHRRLLNYLGVKEYKGTMPIMISQERCVNGRYCVISPGSSVMRKCWPIERFADISDYLIERYDLDVHICGGAPEKEFSLKIIELSKHPDRITDHVGNTSFKEWASIVQHAEIAIGNDSATMHIAAAYRTKAICVAGVHDKYQFFPYRVDELAPDDRLPETVLVDMPCEYCVPKGYFAGYGNKECADRISANKCSLCIDLVKVTMVKDKIDSLLSKS